MGTSFEAEQASLEGGIRGEALGRGRGLKGRAAPSVGARGPQMQLRPDDEGGRWLGAGAGLERTAQKVGATGVIAVGRFWGQLETRWP